MERESRLHETTTGHMQSDNVWLDAHFTACRNEYERMVTALPVRHGWHVLDAGCGNGVFLPKLAELVGPSGRITANDLAPEHVADLTTRLRLSPLACHVTVDIGNVVSLSYEADSFDGVWCGAVTQYLSDDELRTMLSEMYRVTRPGGWIAIKDFSPGHNEFHPIQLALLWRLYQALEPVAVQVAGLMRVRALRRWIESSGFVDVRQHTHLVERWAPLSPADHAWISSFIEFIAGQAQNVELSAEDQTTWNALADSRSPQHPINQPDFYWCEGHVVAVGQKPEP